MNDKDRIARFRDLAFELNERSFTDEVQKMIDELIMLGNEIAMSLETHKSLESSMRAYTDFYTNLSEQMHLNQKRFEETAYSLLHMRAARDVVLGPNGDNGEHNGRS